MRLWHLQYFLLDCHLGGQFPELVHQSCVHRAIFASSALRRHTRTGRYLGGRDLHIALPLSLSTSLALTVLASTFPVIFVTPAAARRVLRFACILSRETRAYGRLMRHRSSAGTPWLPPKKESVTSHFRSRQSPSPI